MIPTDATEAAEQAVIDAMIKYGPDGHIDGFHEITLAALEAAAPILMAKALKDDAGAIDAQRDATHPDRKPDEGWSVIDHREGRFLGKTVAARLLRSRAAQIEATK